MRRSILATWVVLSGCSASTDSFLMDAENDLTSVSARSRTLEFAGYVYVDRNASDATILQRVREQTQSAFGALRTSEISVNSRELKDVDPKTFVKEDVLVRTGADETTSTPMSRVRYRYKDNALVPKSMARRSALPLAVLGNGYRLKTSRILKECTADDSEAHEFSSSIWYVFEPSLSQCQQAISSEQESIDKEAVLLHDGEVGQLEIERLYIPITVSLGPDATNRGKSYPEYERMYRGGVKSDALVIGMVNGAIDHGSHDSLAEDSGWEEWMTQLDETFGDRAFKVSNIDPVEDLTSFTVGNKTVSAPNGFADVLRWQLRGDVPAGTDPKALLGAASTKIANHWITFRLAVKVRIADEAPRDFAIEVLTYFGAGGDQTPHKFAIKNSDVFIYNGHSYIGYGPLDPSRFSAEDFPASYQLFFVDSCVSYNYYERDYISLKAGGTKNLDLITNGLEAPSWRSGYALGRFANLLTSGKGASYRDLLQVAMATDSLRVVDGEVGNEYDPAKVPIEVTF